MASGGTSRGRFARLRPAIGETIIGAGVLVLAIVMVWQTLSIPVSPIYAQVGPTIVPIITALALGMLGILLLVDAVQGGWQTAEEKEVAPDRKALLWITIASVILFVCVARGFGSKAIVRDALIGAAFALVAYIGFAKTLGINIGSGLVENAIERVIGSEGG
jgi:putative tricarboxylic transport membrane protein